MMGRPGFSLCRYQGMPLGVPTRVKNNLGFSP